MKASLKLVAMAAVMTISAAFDTKAQVPFCAFFDSTTYFDGNPVLTGSIIEAFDPDGVSCGKDTVLLDGYFGFMPVLGDDPTTPGFDEGAEANDLIRFTINGRNASVDSGDAIWQDQQVKRVSLSSNSINIAIAGVYYPPDTTVGFDYTVRIKVGVRNDGDGLDFYGITANSQKGWSITEQPDFVYADPGDTAYIYFDIDIPVWPGNDTTDIVSYSVFSYLDPSQHVDSSIRISSSITVGIGDEYDNILPTGFVLEQNYPNPFNPTTNIAFELPTRTSVRLEFYDILGRQVDLVEMGSLSSGQHIYEFDGSKLATGVYFYRMVAEKFIQSKKMLLVK
ncbi:MAG TPA: T9SS type A sorting domain-containing protein [candidate division Zixibacteria bacterium]|nr:T9SS type A sorting domain-containing protein [candidate division Zixibacteria bacterium]